MSIDSFLGKRQYAAMVETELTMKLQTQRCQECSICAMFFISSSTMFIEDSKCDASEECLSFPWKKKEKCVFTETMRYFGILDKEYQDTESFVSY